MQTRFPNFWISELRCSCLLYPRYDKNRRRDHVVARPILWLQDNAEFGVRWPGPGSYLLGLVKIKCTPTFRLLTKQATLDTTVGPSFTKLTQHFSTSIDDRGLPAVEPFLIRRPSALQFRRVRSQCVCTYLEFIAGGHWGDVWRRTCADFDNLALCDRDTVPQRAARGLPYMTYT